jgi:hypothetical protein
MKFINMIKNIFAKELPKPLGRWSIKHSDAQLNRKIDLSTAVLVDNMLNNDHEKSKHS